jgi:hypothetical protein
MDNVFTKLAPGLNSIIRRSPCGPPVSADSASHQQSSFLRRLLLGADAEAAATVPAELRAAARLRHPCLITVLGFLVDCDEGKGGGGGGGRVRVVMELAALGSLQEVCGCIAIPRSVAAHKGMV